MDVASLEKRVQRVRVRWVEEMLNVSRKGVERGHEHLSARASRCSHQVLSGNALCEGVGFSWINGEMSPFGQEEKGEDVKKEPKAQHLGQ